MRLLTRKYFLLFSFIHLFDFVLSNQLMCSHNITHKCRQIHTHKQQSTKAIQKREKKRKLWTLQKKNFYLWFWFTHIYIRVCVCVGSCWKNSKFFVVRFCACATNVVWRSRKKSNKFKLKRNAQELPHSDLDFKSIRTRSNMPFKAIKLQA